MDEILDPLQTKIEEAKRGLSKETLHAIDFVDWKNILRNIGQKNGYNTEQIEDLELETELILCGLLMPDEYPVKIESELKIPKDEVMKLINEINELIFKKISDELIKIIGTGSGTSVDIGQKTSIPVTSLMNDPQFAKLPKELREAINESGYQSKIYAIAKEKELSINQVQTLEEVTSKVLLNIIHPDRFEEELKLKLELDGEKVSGIVTAVNEDIIKNIREIMRTHLQGASGSIKDLDEEVPIPPYSVIKIQTPINIPKEPIPLPKTESKIYENAGIEMVNDEKPDIIESVIASKLGGNTMSKPIVSDQSLPKVTPLGAPSVPQQVATSAKPHDPYHEAI